MLNLQRKCVISSIKYYEGGEKVKGVKLQALQRKYELLQMGEVEKITSYVSKVQNIIHLMKGCGEILTDKMIFEKVCECCPITLIMLSWSSKNPTILAH